MPILGRKRGFTLMESRFWSTENPAKDLEKLKRTLRTQPEFLGYFSQEGKLQKCEVNGDINGPTFHTLFPFPQKQKVILKSPE